MIFLDVKNISMLHHVLHHICASLTNVPTAAAVATTTTTTTKTTTTKRSPLVL
jgi:hypothetical protein